jgi:glycine cleavage system H lipoate-binding protein
MYVDPSGEMSLVGQMTTIATLSALTIIGAQNYMHAQQNDKALNVSITVNFRFIADAILLFDATVLNYPNHIYLAERAKQAQKHIDGAIYQVNEHLEKMGSVPPDDPNNKDWLKHIKKHLNNIKKYANRLKGQSRGDALKFVEETSTKLKDAADKFNVPWDI